MDEGGTIVRGSELEIFCAVFETGSFTAAARRLGLTAAATSKSVLALEKRLGARLFERTTRHVRPTEAGEALHARVAPALAEIEDAEERVASARGAVRGRVRLDVPVAAGVHLLPGPLARFRLRHPEIELLLTSADGYTDLVAERVDVALRMDDLAPSGLVARTLGRTRLVTCASPDYLARRGTPRRVEELASHDCIAYVRQADGRPFAWRFQVGRSVREWTPPLRLCVNDGGANRGLAIAGAGVIQDLGFSLVDDLRAGRLVPILPRSAAPGPPLSLLYASGRHLPARVRVLLDFLARELGSAQLDPPVPG